jgi:hypothetical protein
MKFFICPDKILSPTKPTHLGRVAYFDMSKYGAAGQTRISIGFGPKNIFLIFVGHFSSSKNFEFKHGSFYQA